MYILKVWFFGDIAVIPSDNPVGVVIWSSWTGVRSHAGMLGWSCWFWTCWFGGFAALQPLFWGTVDWGWLCDQDPGHQVKSLGIPGHQVVRFRRRERLC